MATVQMTYARRLAATLVRHEHQPDVVLLVQQAVDRLGATEYLQFFEDLLMLDRSIHGSKTRSERVTALRKTMTRLGRQLAEIEQAVVSLEEIEARVDAEVQP